MKKMKKLSFRDQLANIKGSGAKFKKASKLEEPMPSIAKSYMAGEDFVEEKKYSKKDRSPDSEGFDLKKSLNLKKLKKNIAESITSAGMARRPYKTKSDEKYESDREEESEREDKEGYSGHGMKKRLLNDIKSLKKRKNVIDFDLV